MVVQHNLTAMNANRYLGINNSKLSKSLEKLSSGYAINRAGDNAAGLAVSEKMRSQIAGMTQGVKNAQDGISMVQTFEGALTETHSILQRMKTLADQMGNDSYDDPVDRKAAQQEFLQLNDELNQIADTDFNGVVVLNGGVMADGLEQVDGKFDYANKAGQVAAKEAAALADAQKAAQAKIDSAEDAYHKAMSAYEITTKRDLCLAGNATQWNTVDDNSYKQGVAADLFGKVSAKGVFDADKDGTIAENEVSTLAQAGVKEFNVQFVYDGGKWKVNGKDVNADITANNGGGSITLKTGEDAITTGAWYTDEYGVNHAVTLGAAFAKDIAGFGKIETTANGGFIVNDGKYGNAILETKDVREGDVVTLTYTNSPVESYTPTNIGREEESVKNNITVNDPKISLEADAMNKNNMDAELSAALEALDKSGVNLVYTSNEVNMELTGEGKDLFQIEDSKKANGEFMIQLKKSDGSILNIAKVTADKPHAVGTAKAKDTMESTTKKTGAGDKTLKGSSTNAGIADGSAEFVMTNGKWVATGNITGNVDAGWKIDNTVDGQNDYDFTKADLEAFLTEANKVNEGDKISMSWTAVEPDGGDVVISANNVNFTPSDKTTANLAGAADADADGAVMERTYTYDGTNWIDEAGETQTTFGNLGGKVVGGADAATIESAVTGTKMAGDTITISAKDGDSFASISYSTAKATQGTVSFNIKLDEWNYDPNSTGPTIDPTKSPNGKDTRDIDKAYADAKKAYQDAKAAYPNSIDDLPKEYKVSKSDAFNNSEAIMTYKDQMILQVGARTKDAVNFTFQYDSEAIGDLKADLNCTAKGLGTDKLSLSTQEEANYAVDKIDQAINKVSLIRGTFGAIQNRLEHKIDNMNVSIENLTSAESAIRDTNMPQEMMNFTKQQILAQASQSMLAQANQLPQGVLSLLQ